MSSPGEPVVLLAFANVDPLRPLRDLPREGKSIRKALEPLVASKGLADPVMLWNATANDVLDELRNERLRGRIRVFHFGGHADASALMLANEDGTPGTGDADGLADYLGEQDGLELVVLNGCSTRAQVARLREVGVRAVVATSRAIKDDVAADFAAELFKELVGKPLREAFEAATKAVRFKKGTALSREVDLEELEGEAWDQESPWVLSCAKRDCGWRLGAEGSVERVDDGDAEIDDVLAQEIIERLAGVIHEPELAVVVLSRAGVPRGRVPRFDTPLGFWQKMVDGLRSGLTEGKLSTVLEVVGGMYPGNSFFGRFRRG